MVPSDKLYGLHIIQTTDCLIDYAVLPDGLHQLHRVAAIDKRVWWLRSVGIQI